MFRQKALDALSNPEKLDQPFQLIRPTYWIVLISLGGFTMFLLLWSILGRLPVRIKGRGVLVEANTVQVLQSEHAGRLTSLSIRPGDCVSRDQVVARIDSEDYQLKLNRLQDELTALMEQDVVEDGIAKNQILIARNDLMRLQPFRKTGSISEQTFVEKESLIASLKAKLEGENNARYNQILNKRLELKTTENELIHKTSIRAPRAGCIADLRVQIGQYIQPGTPILELVSERKGTHLDSLAYFPPSDGKRLKVGQIVNITPVTTQSQRHGGIEGTVLSVKELPVSRESLLIRLGSASIVDSIFNGAQGQVTPLIEVRTSLRKDRSTYSGYYWEGGPGPRLKLSPGTPTELRVLVELRQPISYLIPTLRDLSGIY